MAENLQRIRLFRAQFKEFQAIIPSLIEAMPHALAKLYSDCQEFAEDEIKKLLQEFEQSRQTLTNHRREQVPFIEIS